MRDRGLNPADLIQGNIQEVLSDWKDKSITLDRVRILLARGGALGLLLEKWTRSGLWVITRSDPRYPRKLKAQLRTNSPPVIFGCGDMSLLNSGGMAIVGSRNAEEADLAFTREIGRLAASDGVCVVSGGARGVDETAMLGALESDGQAIGVLGDNLLRACLSGKYRNRLADGNLVLITPFNPEEGFKVANAMARNKYIYCLADDALVVTSTPNKGGTWSGAVEDLRHSWVPLWVRRSEHMALGNKKLVEQGGRWFPEELKSLRELRPA